MVIRGARQPEQLEPVDAMTAWCISETAMSEIDTMLDGMLTDPAGREFMAQEPSWEKREGARVMG